jgi:IS5 family transposase
MPYEFGVKGKLGEALHAVLCGAGHNIRLLLKKLRLFYAYILFCCTALGRSSNSMHNAT